MHYKAATTIYPSRFISIFRNANDEVVNSGDGDFPIGISREYSENAWVEYIARPGYELEAYTIGQIGYLELGGTCTRGDYLAPDYLGRGLVSSGWCGCVAEESGHLGEKIRVLLVSPKLAYGFTIGFDTGFQA